MGEHEDELKKALAENGNFDAETAKRVAAEAGGSFDRRLKWLGRITWLRTLACMALMVVGYVGLVMTVSTKGMIGFAVLLLIGFVALCVVDFQYRITNSKVNLLKEIKLLRLEHLRRPTGEATAQARETIAASTNLWRTLPLSLGEDVAWYLSLVLVAAAVGLFTLWFAVSPEAMVPTVESYVTLAPDGSGTETMKVSYPYSGWVPRTSFPFTTSDPNASIRWVDSQGRQLPATVTTSDGQRRYTVRLVEPAMPGGQVRYTQITEVPALAASKDDLWTCRGYRAFGVAKNGSPPGPGLIVGPTLVDSRERQAEFSETVQLPEGAEIVKADPKPLGLFIWDGTPARFFTATRGRNEAFTYTIQYRLPKSNTHSETAK